MLSLSEEVIKCLDDCFEVRLVNKEVELIYKEDGYPISFTDVFWEVEDITDFIDNYDNNFPAFKIVTGHEVNPLDALDGIINHWIDDKLGLL